MMEPIWSFTVKWMYSDTYFDTLRILFGLYIRRWYYVQRSGKNTYHYVYACNMCIHRIIYICIYIYIYIYMIMPTGIYVCIIKSRCACSIKMECSRTDGMISCLNWIMPHNVEIPSCCFLRQSYFDDNAARLHTYGFKSLGISTAMVHVWPRCIMHTIYGTQFGLGVCVPKYQYVAWISNYIRKNAVVWIISSMPCPLIMHIYPHVNWIA